jgi:hypothetical protein
MPTPITILWCGWSEMQRDLTEIKEPAAEIRRSRGSGGQGDGPEAQRVGAKIKGRSSRAAPAGSFWPMLQAARASTKCSQSEVSTL